MPYPKPTLVFPEYAAGTSVCYSDYDVLILDLSRRAAGYGRRKAGVSREPPPLPKCAEVDLRPWWHEHLGHSAVGGIAEGHQTAVTESHRGQ